MLFFILVALGYFIGSIPFGLLLTKWSGGGDIRSQGSGNIGATNVLRTGKKSLAAATLLCDVLKGTVAVLLGTLLSENAALLAGFAALIGHIFPVWLRFKGGKGVATYLGLLLGLTPLCALIFAAVWITIAFAFRYSSLAALIACIVTPFVLFIWTSTSLGLVFTAASLMLFWTHRTNMQRLRSGKESKIGS
jgi:acyl phosphate:glycerol-3-phosphate acyltransferase